MRGKRRWGIISTVPIGHPRVNMYNRELVNAVSLSNVCGRRTSLSPFASYFSDRVYFGGSTHEL